MKHIKTINEIFGIRDKIKGAYNNFKFNGESTAVGILKSMTDDLDVLYQEEDDIDDADPFYQFNIDGFSISVRRRELGSIHYYLFIDDTHIEASSDICKKIFMKCWQIEKKSKEEPEDLKRKESEDFTRRDAKIHFRKR